MPLFILIILAVLISRYAKRRSKIIYRAHAMLFAFYFVFSLFTVNVAPIVLLMEKICGVQSYLRLREQFLMPSGWIYSAGAALAIIELLYGFIVAVFTAKYVAKKISNIKAKFYRKVSEKDKGNKYPKKNLFAERKIFLSYCRLLN